MSYRSKKTYNQTIAMIKALNIESGTTETDIISSKNSGRYIISVDDDKDFEIEKLESGINGSAKYINLDKVRASECSQHELVENLESGTLDDNHWCTNKSIYDLISHTSRTISNIICNVTNGSYVAPNQIVADETASLVFLPESGYAFPSTVTVTGASYMYYQDSGLLRIIKPTGNVTITAICPVGSYTIPDYTLTFQVDHCTVFEYNSEVTYYQTPVGSILKFNIVPFNGYELPQTINFGSIIKEGKYNNTTGELFIVMPASDVTLDITAVQITNTIKSNDFEFKKFTVSSAIDDVTVKGVNTINSGASAYMLLTSTKDVPLPYDYIKVDGANHTYDEVSNILTLSTPMGSTALPNVIKITNNGHLITARIEYGTYTGPITMQSTASITIIPRSGYDLPSAITVTGADYTYSSTTGIVNLSNPSGNIIITAVCTPNPSAFMKITANTANSTVQLNIHGTLINAIDISYSVDDCETWDTFLSGTSGSSSVITLAQGSSIYFKNSKSTLSESDDNYCNFELTGSVKIENRIDSLINWSNDLTDYCFYQLFMSMNSSSDEALTQVDNSLLTSYITMKSCCYAYMFYDCEKITSAPYLPATELANYCYWRMFFNCEALISTADTPHPSTGFVMKEACCAEMYYWCSNITTMAGLYPISATAKWCCMSMYVGCVKLVINNATLLHGSFTPEIQEYAYAQMFAGCDALTVPQQILNTDNNHFYLHRDALYGMYQSCDSLKVTNDSSSGTKFLYMTRACASYMFLGIGSFTPGGTPDPEGTPLSNTYYYYY